MSALENIRKNIKRLLELHGKTPTSFAREIGMAQPLFHGYMSGKSNPGIEQIERIALALGVSVAALIEDDTPKFASPRAPTPEEMAISILSALQVSDDRLALIRLILTADHPDIADAVRRFKQGTPPKEPRKNH